MKTPQIIFSLLMIMSIVFNIVKHGKEKRDENNNVLKYNVWNYLVVAAIWIALLCWGKFFIEVRMPQILVIIILGLFCGMGVAKDGKEYRNRKGIVQKYNAWDSIIGVIIMGALLYWGGFFY